MIEEILVDNWFDVVGEWKCWGQIVTVVDIIKIVQICQKLVKMTVYSCKILIKATQQKKATKLIFIHKQKNKK